MIKSEQNLKKLCVNFSSLMNDSTNSDFIIVVEAHEFRVHKSVIGARSNVFMKMFASNMKEAKDGKLEIVDTDQSTFEKLLHFIYCDKIPEDLDYFAMNLFIAADKV